ncbi:MAG: hypothetical protein HY361_00225 [Candidatus Aenigmarchaeota archaeon]|nr:hypothetical protein [Candidatus Aenigmarchaeota archaeon]
MRNSGQVITIDFFVAVTAITILIAFVVLSWNQAVEEFRSREMRTEMTVSTINLADSLVKSQGDPSSWENISEINNINSLGLVVEDHILDSSKLIAFVGLGESNLKKILGIQNYNFYFKVSDGKKTVNLADIKLENGSYPNSSASAVINSQRIALLKNTPVYLDFVLWR